MAMTVDEPESVSYFGNRQSIGRAVANLVDNALKYGGGSISLGAADHNDWVELWVADSGSGIPPEQREQALGRYRRLEVARTTEGSGLGLALARAVARLHGGEIHLLGNEPGLRAVITLMRGPHNLSRL
jgi:signal transduction histidine kinase